MRSRGTLPKQQSILWPLSHLSPRVPFFQILYDSLPWKQWTHFHSVFTHQSPFQTQIRDNNPKMKNGPEVSLQLPETKLTNESGPLSGPLVSQRPENGVTRRKADVMHAAIRLLCLLTSLTAVSVMTKAEQASTISLYGFTLPLYSKWSFSDSFE